MPSLSDSPPPIPPPVPVETHPYRAVGLKSPAQQRALPDPTRLAPEDAYYSQSLIRSRSTGDGDGDYDDSVGVLNGAASVAALRPVPAPGRKDARKVRGTSRRRRKGAWKKLLWVKQSCTCLNGLAAETASQFPFYSKDRAFSRLMAW